MEMLLTQRLLTQKLQTRCVFGIIVNDFAKSFGWVTPHRFAWSETTGGA